MKGPVNKYSGGGGAGGRSTELVGHYVFSLPNGVGHVIYFQPQEGVGHHILSGCLPKILITHIGHKIDFLHILYVNCTLSGYFKNTFRLGSKCFLRQFTRGVPWWTKMEIYPYKNANFQ